MFPKRVTEVAYAFHLGFFCILVTLLLSLLGQNGLLLFQTALSLLMPQVLGLGALAESQVWMNQQSP